MAIERLDYEFRSVSTGDLPLIRRWLETPQVAKWWPDPQRQYDLIKTDLNNPDIRMQLVETAGEAFAYIQDYDVRAMGDLVFGDVPDGARAIDTFIGVPAMLGQGHGSKYVRYYVDWLKSVGVPHIVIGPDAANEMARRAYLRAGFTLTAVVASEKGDVALMEI